MIAGEKRTCLNPIASPHVHNGKLNKDKMEYKKDEEISCVIVITCITIRLKKKNGKRL